MSMWPPNLTPLLVTLENEEQWYFYRRIPEDEGVQGFEVFLDGIDSAWQLTLECHSDGLRVDYIGHQNDGSWPAATGLPFRMMCLASKDFGQRIFSSVRTRLTGPDSMTDRARQMWERFEDEGHARRVLDEERWEFIPPLGRPDRR